MNQDAEITTTSPWFRESRLGEIAKEDIELIKRLGQMQIYPKGSYVHFDGDFIEDFMYIDKGLARFFISNEDGVEKTVYYTDRFVSIECYFHRQPTHTNCIAEEEIVLYRVKREYEDVLMERKSIRDLVVQSLAVKCRINGWQVSDLTLAKPIQRIARILCCYYFDEKPDSHHKLLHQEIADLTGLHRVTVTNYINDLRKMGIIEQTKHKTWIVKDRQALRDLAFEGDLMERY